MVVDASHNIIRTQIDKTQLHRIAALWSVRTIESIPQLQLTSNIARQTLKVDRVQDPFDSKEFCGEGEIIAIADSGLDTGDPSKMHPSFAGRVVAIHNYNLKDYNENLAGQKVLEYHKDDWEGHGTHVAGCALGGPVKDDKGDIIQGAAPKAGLLAIAMMLEATEGQKNEKQSMPSVPGLHGLFEVPYPTGATFVRPKIHSNSWNTFARFSEEQQDYGEATGKVVDEVTWTEKTQLICFGAGNDGRSHLQDGRQIGSVAAAKNCITVGATVNARSMVYDMDYQTPSQWMADAKEQKGLLGNLPPQPSLGQVNCVTEFSSRGPTKEGRMKPDVVAPGGVILSAKSKSDNAHIKNDYGDNNFTIMSGTSMACPFVSGCAAVLREALSKRRHLQNPSSALLKALIIHGASDLAISHGEARTLKGQSENGGTTNVEIDYDDGEKRVVKVLLEKPRDPIPLAPNGIQGHGLVDLEASLRPIWNDSFSSSATPHADLLDFDTGLLQGIPKLVRELKITGAFDLTVTLVWTDRPGKELQNQLRIELPNWKADGTRGDTATFIQTPKPINNVEKWTKRFDGGTVQICVNCVQTLGLEDKDRAPFAVVWSIRKV